MEASEATPGGAVHAPDLAEVAAADGPFATVYLTTESRIDNAAHRSEQRWKTLRGELAEAGAPEDALAAIDPVVPGAHRQGEGLAVVATPAGLALVEHGPAAPARDLARWADLPALTTVIEWRQSSPPHLAVLADRRGADLVAIRYGAPDLHREVEGDTEPITKVGPGGWSQRRFQQRAENTWEENAEDVARELTRLAERVDARVVVVAGDVRALQLLQEELPGEILDRLEVVEGGRAADGSGEAVFEEVARRVRQTIDRDTEALLETFRQELGQGDRAVEGLRETMRALSMAQVEVLLVHDRADDERRAWFGPDPTLLASSAEELRELNVERPREGRVVDVLVRAALGTGAGIRVVPPVGGPEDGVGAILRWAETAS